MGRRVGNGKRTRGASGVLVWRLYRGYIPCACATTNTTKAFHNLHGVRQQMHGRVRPGRARAYIQRADVQNPPLLLDLYNILEATEAR